MISIAWSISLLLCIPQAFIFQGQADKCQASFAPGWGLKAYVSWFSLVNLFLPLAILLFCYSRICYDIWENGKLKMKNEGEKTKKRRCFKGLKNCMKKKTRESPAVLEDNPTDVMEDPNAILAFEKLHSRKHSDSLSDSSVESADRNMLEVSAYLLNQTNWGKNPHF